jgi:hypothetical protein
LQLAYLYFGPRADLQECQNVRRTENHSSGGSAMIRRTLIIAGVLMLFGLCLSLPPVRSTSAQERGGTISRTWEYKIVPVSTIPDTENDKGETMQSQLNDMGGKGWEFVQCLNARMIFKRPK